MLNFIDAYTLKSLGAFELCPNDEISIDKNVSCVHIVESNSATVKLMDCKIIETAITVHKNLILIDMSGSPELNARWFTMLLSEKFPHIFFSSSMDGDCNGFLFHRIFKHGSNTCSHINTLLTVPRIRPLSILPHQLKANSNFKCSLITEKEKK